MAAGDQVEDSATDAGYGGSVEHVDEIGVLRNDARQEMLDLEADNRVCLGVNAGIDVVTISLIERDACSRARLTYHERAPSHCRRDKHRR